MKASVLSLVLSEAWVPPKPRFCKVVSLVLELRGTDILDLPNSTAHVSDYTGKRPGSSHFVMGIHEQHPYEGVGGESHP